MDEENYFITDKDLIRIEQLGLDEYGEKRNMQSTVFKGFWVSRRTPVFIKEVDLRTFRERSLTTLKHEAKLLKEIRHPNIALFLGASLKPDNVILVTELLREDLSSLIQKKTLSLYQKLTIAKQICLGMMHLHAVGIVHNDLKLDNIMLDDKGTAKITDFGYSRIIPGYEMSVLPEQASLGKGGGSPLYMPPERLKIQFPLIIKRLKIEIPFEAGKPADVFSYGIILWEIITAEYPYSIFLNTPSPREVEERFVEAVCIHDVRPTTHKPLDQNQLKFANILDFCWKRIPDERPTFSSLVDELDQLLIRVLIPDTDGANFWMNFKTKPNPSLQKFNPSADSESLETVKFEVPWELFLPKFLDLLKEVSQETLEQSEIEAVKPLLVTDDQVTIDKFGRLCSIFGPIRSTIDQKDSIIDRIFDLLSQTWFRKNISAEEAYDLLKHKSNGTFIVRFSGRENKFVISVVLTQMEQVIHFPVEHTSKGFRTAGSIWYPTIYQLLEKENHVFAMGMKDSGVTPSRLELRKKASEGVSTHRYLDDKYETS